MSTPINVREMTGKLNQLRVNNSDKLYTHNQLFEDLRQIGFATTIAQAIVGTLIPSEKIGRNKFYRFSKDPIHFSKLEEIYRKFRNYSNKSRAKRKNVSLPAERGGKCEIEFNQQEAIQKLQAAGYQIRKCVGFDEARFREEHPELYRKYLKYEDL